MKTIKVSEATNIQLNWLVAKCQGFDAAAYEIARKAQSRCSWEATPVWTPTTNWSQMGPIIERDKMDLYQSSLQNIAAMWRNTPGGGQLIAEARDQPTLLVAAARCYVVSKMGNEVEVPAELV